jgi:hypothetical protein
VTDRLELPILGNGDFLEYGSQRISALAECRFRLKFKCLVDSSNVSFMYVCLIVLPAQTGQVKGAEQKGANAEGE